MTTEELRGTSLETVLTDVDVMFKTIDDVSVVDEVDKELYETRSTKWHWNWKKDLTSSWSEQSMRPL